MLNGFGVLAESVFEKTAIQTAPQSPSDFENTEEEIKEGTKGNTEKGFGEAQYIRSNTNSLCVRSEPRVFSSVLGYLDKNDMAACLGYSDGFYKTVYKEKTAYISAKYCDIIKIEKGSQKTEAALSFGATLLGYPYVYGSQRYHYGNGKLNPDFVNGEFDCSALTQYIFYISAGVILDSTTRTQLFQGEAVAKADIKRGDLLFFTNSARKNLSGTERIGHVAIYLGDNYILHTASDHAVIEPISAARWENYITARRVL